MLKRLALLLILASAILPSLPTHVSGDTITVPDQYPTIQEAVDAAHAEDTILIKPGKYDDHVEMDKEDLTLTVMGTMGSPEVGGLYPRSSCFQ